jgi:transformation/transcription domain-associated protein
MNSRAAAQKKIQEAQALAARAAAAGSGEAPSSSGAPATSADGDIEMKDVKDEAGGNANPKPTSQNGSVPPPSAASMQPAVPRAPYEMLEEISNMLKTAFPLLALMMERMVDHISIRAKPNSEEDIYRFFAALLNDAMQVSKLFSVLVMLSLILSNGVAETWSLMMKASWVA